MIECRLITNASYSLEEREQLLRTFFAGEERPHVFLKTCNRIELYRGEGDVSDDVVRHLYRVASGLESALTGERAIQGQIKNAYTEACSRYKLSAQLHRLFQTAMHTGKRVRSETRISEGAVSHSQVTASILKASGLDLKEKIVSIIGVNKLTEDILKFLTDKQAVNIFLSNRNLAKAQALAAQYGGTAMPLGEKKRMMEFTDILICATSAPHLLITAEDIPLGKEMLLFDLAFPRDVDPALSSREGIQLYDLEQIEEYARANRSQRNNAILAAEQIIEEEITKFKAWSNHPKPITTQ